MPPPSRNHRVPTAGDTPATTPASSLETRQRPPARSVADARAALPAGGPATAAQAFPLLPPTLLAAPSTHRLIEVLRRPLEFTPYTSAQLARFAREHNLVRSVGRTAVWDNAQAESFWATLKVEFYDRYLWPTRQPPSPAVGDWIERVYNRRRRHSTIGIISPVDFEDRLTQTAQAA